ncbi:DUF2937 family protein [Paracoccus sp. 11-3]|uniref:DUF2937 family protein n=1 Tax=Paracoccus amoyensis TaxID=2760093 RepID=A0A926GBQ1_9RHOB|nr:DUF2937 family protein [Paracoccus amoyensis]MBC9247041.1 DUF2937 family protein [Paracoccus amoyensis]
MMGFLRLTVALICAICLSQFPAFSDQYVQRLGGQVDSLTRVASEFDASARRADMTREQALADLSGSNFRDAHQADMRSTFARLEHAESDLAMLRLASPLERMALPHRLRDTETLTATWGDFRPAIPVTAAGLWAAGIGFALGWMAMTLLGFLFRRRPEPVGWR